MPTLEALCKEYGIDLNEGQEKTASAESDEAQIANELDNTEETESNLDGGNNMSLTDVYNETFTEEQEKVAEVVEDTDMEKVAEDFVAAGRFMARGFYDELEKIASAPAQEAADEELPTQLSAEGAAKTKVSDKAGLKVNTSEAKNQYRDILKEKYINAMLNKGKGVNVSGSTGQDNKVAPDAAK